MKTCECARPNPKGATANKPNDDERCVQCGLYVPPGWSDIRPFFDRLEEAFAHDITSREAIQVMRVQSELRHQAGVPRFGLKHLSVDNAAEALEEASDGANYSAYAILGQRRRGEEVEWPLALTAAYHFAMAHRALRHMRAHKHTPISDA